MTFPLVILAFFAITAGWVGIPDDFLGLSLRENWFHEFVGGTLLEHPKPPEFSFVPLLVSIGVALGGLYLGWVVYRNIKVGEEDPLKRRLGAVYTWMQNKYYFDELYDAVFVRPSYWLAHNFSYLLVDRQIIDGILHSVARVTGVIGAALRNYIDAPIVNGFGDLVGESVKWFGKNFRVIQTGRIQQYLVLALVNLVALGVLFYLLLVGLPGS
jgi:NADH-quinone oxidoreductase subunit L